MRRILLAASTIVVSLAVGCATPSRPPAERADLVLRGGKVVTVDPNTPDGEAIAVRGDRIVAVGTDAEIDRLIGPATRVIDLHGRLVVPGFIESHGHLVDLGLEMMELDLRKARTWDEVVALVEQEVENARPGEWIRGNGFHPDKWEAPPSPSFQGLPYHTALSAVSPDNPVVLHHASGHGSFFNAKALELAGVGPDTPDPAGGEIVRDSSGRILGMFREGAREVVFGGIEERRGPPSQEQIDSLEAYWQARIRRGVQLAGEAALAKGVTSFQDHGAGFEFVDMFRQLVDEGAMPLRIYAMVREDPESLAENMAKYRTIGYGGNRLTVRALGEIGADGALGTHGAWFTEPYADEPSSTGIPDLPMDTIRKIAELALEHGYQVTVHAIGDRANHEVLNLYAQIFREHPEATDLRWRIEHAQHLLPGDIPRFGEMDVIASMQSIHACSDAAFVVKRLGEERAEEGAYVWRSLLDSGARIANGTDAPVEPVDPIANIACAVTRRSPDGSAFFPAQAMTRREALRSYTRDAAYAEFAEDLKGTLTPGKLADLVVLDRDILTVPEREIAGTSVDYTVLGGTVVYERGAAER